MEFLCCPFLFYCSINICSSLELLFFSSFFSFQFPITCLLYAFARRIESLFIKKVFVNASITLLALSLKIGVHESFLGYHRDMLTSHRAKRSIAF